jgi:NhaP-type Na+/H+ or K+/H+ antiporter
VLLAVVAMILTIGAVAAAGIWAGLPIGAAVLLGAVLAPTDPVLASDVQVEHEHDAEPVRFNLTAEAGFNDGTAFPFVMLGLGLIGAHELGAWGSRWVAIDLVWAVSAGLAVGALCGTGIGRVVIYLRRTHREAVGLDEFLTLGLIALSYGSALQIHAYGFLAVFAAGLSVRRIERAEGDEGPRDADVADADPADDEQAAHPETTAASMARAVLSINEQFERLGELALVVAVGAMLAWVETPWPGLALAVCLFAVIRPLATLLTLAPVPSLALRQRAFIAWFGVRGVGSIYYLTFAFSHGLGGADARTLADATLVVVAASVVLHGISVTPLMRWYESRRGRPAVGR